MNELEYNHVYDCPFMNEPISISEINREALISFIAAILALLGLCIGLLPIPFTVIICYPPGIILGTISLVYGMIALREIRADGKRGRRLALAAIWSGGFMLVAAICMITAGILIFPRFIDLIRQSWNQLQP